MTSPLLNQVLDETVQITTELSARAEVIATNAGDVVEHAQTLGLQAVDQARSLHAGYQEAIAAIRLATEQSQGAADAAARALSGVPAEAQKAGTAVVELLTDVHEEVTQLGAIRARLMNGLADSAQQAETEFHDLSLQVEEFTTQLQERLEVAAGHVRQLESVLQIATAALGTAQQSVSAAFAALRQGLVEANGEMAGAVDQALAAVGNGVEEFCNAAIASHNELTATLRGEWIDETKDQPNPEETWVDPIFLPVWDAVAGLKALPPTVESSLSESVDVILEGGEKAVSGLELVTRALQEAIPGTAS